MNYELNKIGENYQICGEVNGLAIKRYYQGVYAYHLDFKFFIGNKLIRIMTSEQDNTVKNEMGIKNSINNIIKKEKE